MTDDEFVFKNLFPADFYKFIRCPLLLAMSVQPVPQENHNFLNVFSMSLEMDILRIILRKIYHFFFFQNIKKFLNILSLHLESDRENKL